jgi:hypothetical protein
VLDSLIEKGLNNFYYREQRRFETSKLQADKIDLAHSNFPVIPIPVKGELKNEVAYLLKVPRSQFSEVEELVADEAGRLKEELNPPLPRLYVDFHLYNPILMRGDVQSVPTGLVDSEIRFVKDLRTFWEKNSDESPWKNYEIYLMRNLPRRGLGFFETAGFYPDFLLWMKSGRKQVLAFIEPKGLVRFPEEKVELLADLQKLEPDIGFPVIGFIVTPTALKDIQIGLPKEIRSMKEQWLRQQGVLFQDPGLYVRDILEDMRKLMTPVAAKKVRQP